MTKISETEWQARLKQAESLAEAGTECALCGGTGGWPGLAAFVACKPCNGTGSTVPMGVSEFPCSRRG